MILAMLTAATIHATTIYDPFAQPQTNCDYQKTEPYTACDVIGNPQLFDIQKVDATAADGNLTVTLYFNYGGVTGSGGNLALKSFTVGSDTLIPGDLFFTNPNNIYDPLSASTASYLQYGVPLVNHGSFTAGYLYNISGGVGVETAQQALNDPNTYYRRDEAVLMTGTGSGTAGTVSVAKNGTANGTDGALYAVTLTIPFTSGLQSLLVDGKLGLLFSSADCGNDVIEGVVGVSSAPEPKPIFMVLGGLGLIGFSRVWRKATSKSRAA